MLVAGIAGEHYGIACKPGIRSVCIRGRVRVFWNRPALERETDVGTGWCQEPLLVVCVGG